MEEWLRFAVEEPDDREMLLQYFGYCLTRDTRQQKFMIITGAGGTGKSTMIKLLERIVGDENTCHISISEFSERFASIGLKDKLVNSCSDLKAGDLKDTSRLKKIIGEDMLRGEDKGKDAISFRSCAKLIFAANALPLIKDEKSNGFYRRLLILPMNHIPEKPREDLFEQLEKELPYFLHLCVEALIRMHQGGHIAESRQSRRAVAQLRYESDPVEAFLMDETDRTYQGQVKRGELYSEYMAYCMSAGLKYESRNAFYNAMRIKGHAEKTVKGNHMFCGVSLKDRSVMPVYPKSASAISSSLM